MNPLLTALLGVVARWASTGAGTLIAVAVSNGWLEPSQSDEVTKALVDVIMAIVSFLLIAIPPLWSARSKIRAHKKPTVVTLVK